MEGTTMDIELRRCRSTLRIVGTGVIAFAVWAALKPFLILLMVPTGTVDSTLFQELPLSDKIIAVFMILLLEALVIGFRLYLGFSARAEGLGKRKGKVYIILTFVYFFIQISSNILTVGYLIKRGGSAQTFAQAITSLILEISSTVTTGEMAFMGVKVKRLSARLRGTV